MSSIGTKILWLGEGDILADIWFVHGLRGDRLKTWTKDNVCWPKDLLKQDIKQARTITWGYDANILNLIDPASQASIFAHAENLLTAIMGSRLRNIKEQSRPIIFVGHSLGGLIIKQALIRAADYHHNEENAKKGAIFELCKSVIFLGTPHRGSSTASWASLATNIAQAVGQKPNSALLQTLEQESHILENQRKQFASISAGLSIVCINEELKYRGVMIVPQPSACIDGFGVETATIHANHMDMCKFSDIGDPGYQVVSTYILVSMQVIMEGPRLTPPQRESLDKILEWLSAPDTEDFHYQACQKRVEHTGDWLLKDSEGPFTRWKVGKPKTGQPKLLWIYGKAGCGKTVLCSSIIEDIKQYCENRLAQVAFFYFSFSDHGKQSYNGLLRSLVAQLMREKPPLPAVENTYKVHSRESPNPFLQDILCQTLARGIGQTFLIIDALDECPANNVLEGRSKTLKWLQDLFNRFESSLHVLVTSRQENDIQESMEEASAVQTAIDTSAVDEDIRRYVEMEIACDRKLRKLDSNNKETIQKALAEKADGMFRWAYCQLEELKNLKSTRRKYVMQALETLPLTLDETYDRMLQRIDGIYFAEAHTALQWLAVSQEPLTLRQLSEACLINAENKPYLDEENRCPVEEILNILSGLVVIIPGSSHPDSEYGSELDTIQQGSSKEICISEPYSSPSEYDAGADDFELKLTGDAPEPDKDSHKSRMDAAELNECVKSLSGDGRQIIGHELQSGDNGIAPRGHVLVSKQRKTDPAEHYDEDMHFGERASQHDFIRLAHFSVKEYLLSTRILGKPFCAFGLNEEISNAFVAESCVAYLLHCSCHKSIDWSRLNVATIQALDEEQLPLFKYASTYWYEHSRLNTEPQRTERQIELFSSELHLQRLLVIEKVYGCPKIREEFRPSWTSPDKVLYIAIYFQLFAVTKQTLEVMAEIDTAHCASIFAVASQTSQKMDIQILNLLLDKGMNPNMHVEDGYPLLRRECEKGRAAVVKALLEHGADPDCTSQDGQSALVVAAQKDHSGVIELLVKGGANVQGNHGVLNTACYHDSWDSVDILINAGAHLSAKGAELSTALQAAARSGRLGVIRLLIDAGTDVDFQAGYYGTALQVAAMHKNVGAVKALIEAGADVNLQGGALGTALKAAAYGIDGIEVVRALIEAGADVNLHGRHNWTALQVAAREKGSIGIIRALIEAGADVNAQAGYHGTALQLAAREKGSIGIIRALIEAGADVNAQAGYHGTALQAATRFGNLEVVEALIKACADVSPRDRRFGTALSQAAEGGNQHIVAALIAAGADIEFRNAGPEHTLLRAIQVTNPSREVVNVLIDAGADFNAEYNGHTPLQAAAFGGNRDIVEVLIKAGAHIDANGGYYGTALHAAWCSDHPDKEMICGILMSAGAKDTTCTLPVNYWDISIREPCPKSSCVDGELAAFFERATAVMKGVTSSKKRKAAEANIGTSDESPDESMGEIEGENNAESSVDTGERAY